MSLAIGGINNPFKKAGGVNPFMKASSSQQTQNQDQNAQNQSNPIANQSKNLSPEQMEEQLKKYSKSMSAYGMAMLNMQNSPGGGMVGTETCGSCG